MQQDTFEFEESALHPSLPGVQPCIGSPKEEDSSDFKLILDTYAYLDLEVNAEEKIFSVGYLSKNWAVKAAPEQAEAVCQHISQLSERLSLLCGHNIRRFDQDHLVKQWPTLQDLWIIDTLELSVLAFPLEPSHRLQKDYKLSDFASNDPLEDARATRLLLEKILQKLAEQPQTLRDACIWLLSCGKEEGDRAYQRLFEHLGWQVAQAPEIETLPESALQRVNRVGLEHLWQASSSFETRLSVAALLAWNHQRSQTNTRQAPSAWLNHLPAFPNVLNSLFPITPEGFTYQPYLQDFGVPNFRGIQEKAVQAIVAGQNPLILMPTGGGKSLCYQLPALMYYRQQWGLTVCISPLQALMEDQVMELNSSGLDFATFINGNLPAQMRADRLEAVHNGQIGLLYISPEQLRSISIRDLLRKRPPVLWVIDEAHCISQWGKDFRPDYRYIPKFIYELYFEQSRSLPHLALLTATATAQVRSDIVRLCQQHHLQVQQEFVSPLHRENLSYRVAPVQGNKEALIAEAVQEAQDQGGCALVYTTTRREAERLAMILQQQGIAAKHYHGQISKEEKTQVLQAFKRRELNVITATCAFGMGINRKDVRMVIHHTPSSSLEGYIQEAGRAGRDGNPAVCLLLFDEKDAETIFFIKSLSRLSISDLRNIFDAVRGVGRRIQSKSTPASDDWFWVTAEEIYQTSELDERFATEDDQRDTKIQVALHHLENFGLMERAENLSTSVQFHLKHSTPQQSQQTFSRYSQQHQITAQQNKQFERLIYGMHLMQQHHQQAGDRLSLERLSDESGIPIQELPDRIRELQKAEVCSSQIPLTLLVTKGVSGDARKKFERYCSLEADLLEAIANLIGSRDSIQINLRGLATRLNANNQEKLGASALLKVLEGWQSLRWIKLKQLNHSIFQIQALDGESGPLAQVIEWQAQHQHFCSRLLDCLYAEIDQKLDTKTGARLVVPCELQTLLRTVCDRPNPTEIEEKRLKQVLLWMHQQEFLRLTDGLTLFHQALKVKVYKGASITTIDRQYPTLEKHYIEQARKTHWMLEYGKLAEDEKSRQKMVEDYFTLAPDALREIYPRIYEQIHPLTQQDYDRIMGPLNSTQQAIVEAEDRAIAVIAGPGSGKTRTIVHRIAYLIQVKRVNPDRILVLAYNRNAVSELRLRLQDLVGRLASRLKVHTFHSLALSLLGRTLDSQDNQAKYIDLNRRFEQVLQEACDLLEKGSEGEIIADEDIQVRRAKLLGSTEYIFVDEYQDVAEQEYRLIQLLSGLTETENKSRTVQINLCVIGDDDQNIYEFRGTSPKYILQFEAEYQAKRFLLTENYRSTESIITTANQFIQSNLNRCKQRSQEQVRIDAARIGQTGTPVRLLQFSNPIEQALWITEQVQQWLQAGVTPNQIAVLARHWDKLKEVRALLERLAHVSTYTLKGRDIKLTRNYLTQFLLNVLKRDADITISAEVSIQDKFQTFFEKIHCSPTEPTVKALLKIAEDLDRERGYGSEELSRPLSMEEVITAIYEFDESPDTILDRESVLVTSCHSAKGLEFSKVILLSDDFATASHEIEQERRLFYVAMTRARDELIFCGTQPSSFLTETKILAETHSRSPVNLPTFIYYADLTPADIYLGYGPTQKQQQVIQKLREGDRLLLQPNAWGDGWVICDANNIEVGALSRKARDELLQNGFDPKKFQFQPGEVTVRHIYRHLKSDEVTGELQEDWYVVIPQIRVYR